MNIKNYILTIDEGTSSTRCILFDKQAKIVTISQMEIDQICPKDGYVEQNAQEIWLKVKETISNVLKQANIGAKDISAIGITNQRETTVVFDKRNGVPIHNALVWQSRQSQSICDELIDRGLKDFFMEKTGLVINAYFSLSKVKWIFENIPNAFDKAVNGELLFGTIDTFLLYHLTNNIVHATDYTNASRTMMYNIYDLCWDKEILSLLNIPESILPTVLDSNSIFGYATGLCDIDKDFASVPIASVIGDQQASLFGQCCFSKGDVKNTYGTGCFMLMNTEDPVINPKYGLLSTISWGLDGKVSYCLEGSVFIAGAGILWLRDMMEFFDNFKECEKSLKDDDPSKNIYLVPAFVGLGTPYWDSDCRGAIFGITKTTNKDNIVAACVESIAYQTKDVLDVMEEVSNVKITNIGVDGGVCSNNYLMQFQANIMNINLERPVCRETTALGATFIAGLKVGFFKDIDEVKRLAITDTIFTPNMDQEKAKKLVNGWKKAVNATLMYKNIN